MSTTHARIEVGSEQERFVGVESPSPMTRDKLDQMQPPSDTVGEGETAVFAVAHQTGIVQYPADEREYEAIAVLYVTRDGEQVSEKWVATSSLSEIERAAAVANADLEPAGENAKRFAPIVRRHPVGR